MDSLVGPTVRRLLAREDDATKELLTLIQDPFKQQLSQNSVWASLGTSLGVTAFIAICFSFLRPYNSVVYAPKLKHADEKHAPPPIGKGVFAWFGPLWKTKEQDFVQYAGLDAALFIRFTLMCRNIFIALTILGCCVLVPINWSRNSDQSLDQKPIMRLTPSNVWGDANWGLVVMAWFFNIIICGFLWWNYRKVLALRRQYFESQGYQNSLHARTLMVTEIPKNMSTDEGIARIIDQVAPESSFSRTAIARNVKDLPSLIEQHANAVKKLEKVLATYLKDPHNLPASRPMCHPSKKDPSYGTYPKGQKIDAIEYLTQRIRELEVEIKEVRNAVDKRNTMPYGFASYDDISEAHSIAFALRKKKPQGTTITLAPRPSDIIWDNMPLTPSTRSWRRAMVNLWIILLTLIWVGPNAMIAIFLIDLTNLGKVWPAFANAMNGNQIFWGIVQGVASPAITSLFYLVLPIIFRRLSIRAGDRTKTGRERHVLAKLYSFFVFNNLFVLSLFSSIWSYVSAVVQKTETGTDAWTAIQDAKFADTIFISLCSISPFWITWLLQRNLGAAIDLAQLWTLIYSFFARKFSNPTPRELIELTAPAPFDYASYYNYFLFYSTVTLCYAGIQPLVLPAAALYFVIDVYLKKYLLLYIFITKNESGGQFWRVIFNRFVFGTILSNIVVFLSTWVRGNLVTHEQAFAVAPLPFIMIAFKIYCSRVFDTQTHFYSTQSLKKNAEAALQKNAMRTDRLASRFGHPALYKPLITPMVHARAQNILAAVYKGRLSDGREAYSGDTMSTSGYSDAYILDQMATGKPGKSKQPSNVPNFEIVPEGRMDFEFYKNRSDFAEGHGGGGDLYGRPEDLIRPGTPGSMWNGSDGSGSRSASPAPGRSASPGPMSGGMHSPRQGGMSYPSGYSHPGASSPYSPHGEFPPRLGSPMYAHANDSGSNLVRNAAPMPVAPAGSRERSLDRLGRTPGAGGMLGGGPQGYGNLPQNEEDLTIEQDPMQYDYFRSGRQKRNNNGW